MEDKKRELIRRPKEPAKPKQTSWFIEPIGAHTNRVIARRLADLNEIADNSQLQIKDVNGAPHSVYRVESHKLILEFYKSQAEFELKFNVYTRDTLDGPITQSLIDTKEFKQRKNQKKIMKKFAPQVSGKKI